MLPLFLPLDPVMTLSEYYLLLDGEDFGLDRVRDGDDDDRGQTGRDGQHQPPIPHHAYKLYQYRLYECGIYHRYSVWYVLI